MQAVSLRVIQPQPLVQMGPGGGQLAAIEQNGPQSMVGLEQEVRSWMRWAKLRSSSSQLPGPLVLPRTL